MEQSAQMKKILERLEALRNEIDDAKKDESRLEGSSSVLQKQLKEQFKIIDLKELDKEISSLENEEDTLTKKIIKEYKLLESQYEW